MIMPSCPRHRSVMLVMEHTGEPLVDSVVYFSV